MRARGMGRRHRRAAMRLTLCPSRAVLRNTRLFMQTVRSCAGSRHPASMPARRFWSSRRGSRTSSGGRARATHAPRACGGRTPRCCSSARRLSSGTRRTTPSSASSSPTWASSASTLPPPAHWCTRCRSGALVPSPYLPISPHISAHLLALGAI